MLELGLIVTRSCCRRRLDRGYDEIGNYGSIVTFRPEVAVTLVEEHGDGARQVVRGDEIWTAVSVQVSDRD